MTNGVMNLISVGVPALVALTVYVRTVLREQDEHDAWMLEADRRRRLGRKP